MNARLFPEDTPIKNVRLVDEATRLIRELILTGKLPPGAQLRQEDLAQQLTISRTPLREALMKLEQEGLIAVLPRRGFRVVELKLAEAIELYELREMLDGLAARLAAERVTAEGLRRLKYLIDKMDECVNADNPDDWLTYHGAFHEEILRASGNSRLMGLIANIRLTIQRFHPLLLTSKNRLNKAFREHEAIFRAIQAHDPTRAERVARAHIENAKNLVVKISGQATRPFRARRAG
jgi:DNA-binding GntR family transcriptional regulator